MGIDAIGAIGTMKEDEVEEPEVLDVLKNRRES
jgi:hypothetical protein